MNAMLAINFSVEKLYGPAWCFTLDGSPHPGTIIYEPRGGEMPFALIRGIGQILYSTYKMHRDMFVFKK